MICCPICLRKCKNQKSFQMHVHASHKSNFENIIKEEFFLAKTLFGEGLVKQTIEDYKNEKYCIYNLPIPISKLIELMGLKRTSKQERATERYKRSYIAGVQRVYGPEITNPSQAQSVQKKIKETCAKRHGSYERYLQKQRKFMKKGYEEYIGSEKHKSTIIKQQQTCLERYGNSNFGMGEEAKSKSMATKKETISKWEYEERLERTSQARKAVNHRGGYSSKPEKRVRKALIDLDIDAEYNKQLWNYNWDLVFDKTIIEVQGVMWHAKPSIYNENDLIMGKILAKDLWTKDIRKKKKAAEEGYNVVEIWEDEINNRNDEQLLQLVRQRLIENEYNF